MSPLMLWIETVLPAGRALAHWKSARACAATGSAVTATAAAARATESRRRVIGRSWWRGDEVRRNGWERTGYGRMVAPRPLEETVTSPLKVSAEIRAAPPPISKVKRLELAAP